jgi:glycosyltransferase involved in cell wall biosynthesis
VQQVQVLEAMLFSPRGGSAFVTRALTRGLADHGVDVTLVSGSRHDHGELGDARAFYAGLPLHEVDFTPALRSPDPLAYSGPPGTAPLHPSFEDRPGAPDRWFATLDDGAYRRQVDAWARELRAAGAEAADVLFLHHLTPIAQAAAEVAPGTPVVAQIHGTELLMLEELDGDGGAAPHAATWRERLRAWADGASRLLVAPGNRGRAIELLGVEEERFVALPNGFDPEVFRPRGVDRDAVWRRVLVDEPRGWRPGQPPGSVAYGPGTLAAMGEGPVILYVGRFTEVKRLPLLLEAFADALPRMRRPATLVIVGGHPGEWEGEHPAEAIDRLGLDRALLAGWHHHDELAELLNAADLLVLPSARESFGQVIVEAMASGVPPIAAAALGPARIIDDGDTGWLVPVDDRAALAEALVEAVDDAAERRRRGERAVAVARERFTWPALAGEVAEVLRDVAVAAVAR